ALGPARVGPAAEQLGRAVQLAVDLEPAHRLPSRHPRLLSRAAATRSIIGSSSAGASTWTPTGSPSSPVPYGTDRAGWPARLEGTVHTSDTYMLSGSPVLAP